MHTPVIDPSPRDGSHTKEFSAYLRQVNEGLTKSDLTLYASMHLPVSIDVGPNDAFTIKRNRNWSNEALYVCRERLSFSALFVGMCKTMSPRLFKALLKEGCVGVTNDDPERISQYIKFCESFLFPVMNNQLPLHENSEILQWDSPAWAAYEAMNDRFAESVLEVLLQLAECGKLVEVTKDDGRSKIPVSGYNSSLVDSRRGSVKSESFLSPVQSEMCGSPNQRDLGSIPPISLSRETSEPVATLSPQSRKTLSAKSDDAKEKKGSVAGAIFSGQGSLGQSLTSQSVLSPQDEGLSTTRSPSVLSAVSASSVSRVCVWFNDFHLLLAGGMLRKKIDSHPVLSKFSDRVSISLFLHTPFPTSEIFLALPARNALMQNLLRLNKIGFQFFEYARHFISVCNDLLGLRASARFGGRMAIERTGSFTAVASDAVSGGDSATGGGSVTGGGVAGIGDAMSAESLDEPQTHSVAQSHSVAHPSLRRPSLTPAWTTYIAAGHNSIEYDFVESQVESPGLLNYACEIRSLVSNDGTRAIIASVDRLSRMSGILLKLRAFKQFLSDYEQYRHRVVLVLFVASRAPQATTPEHENILNEANSLARGINVELGGTDSCSLLDDSGNLISPAGGRHRQHVFIITGQHAIPWVKVSLLCVADVLLETSLRDGLNLVPLEYLACRHTFLDEEGTLSKISGLLARVDSGKLLHSGTDSDHNESGHGASSHHDPLAHIYSDDPTDSSDSALGLEDDHSDALARFPDNEADGALRGAHGLHTHHNTGHHNNGLSSHGQYRNPRKDEMVLEARQTGRIVISEFTGCHMVISGAFRVNPWHTETILHGLHEALSANLVDCHKKFLRNHIYVESHTQIRWATDFVLDQFQREQFPRDHSKSMRPE